MIRNPYAASKSKAKAAIDSAREKLDLANVSTSTTTSRSASSSDPKDVVVMREVEAYPLLLDHTQNRHCSLDVNPAPASASTSYDTNLNLNPPILSRSPAAVKTVSNRRGDLPIIDRLPSRNVSFTCAEVMTVSELAQRLVFSLDKNPPDENANLVYSKDTIESGKSVRVTGTILYSDTNAQWLLIGDPLAKLKHVNAPNQKYSKPTANIIGTRKQSSTYGKRPSSAIVEETPSVINSTTNHPPEATKNLQRKNMSNNDAQQQQDQRQHESSLSKRIPPSLLRSGKRKLVQFKRKRVNNISSLLLSKKKNTTFSGRSKIPSTKLWTVQDLIRDRSRNYQGITMLIVDLSSMPSLEQSKVGDLVMIIGEVHVRSWTHHLSNIENTSDSSNDINSKSAEVTSKTSMSVNLDESNPTPPTYSRDNTLRTQFGLENVLRLLTFVATQSEIPACNEYKHKHNPSSIKECAVPTKNVTAAATTCKNSAKISEEPDSTEEGLIENNKETAYCNTCHVATAPKQNTGGYVRARIIRNASGTDMNLFQEALFLRRRYLAMKEC